MHNAQESNARRTSPPTSPGPVKPPAEPSIPEEYHRVAETVGLIPSLRLKDNVVQTLVVIVTTGIGLLVAWIASDHPIFLIFGALAGLIVGGVGSGFVLMILGWVRCRKKVQ